MGLLHDAQIVNKHLTKLATGFKAGNCVAESIFPTIKIDKLVFDYIKWDKDALKLRDHLRAEGAKVKYDDYAFTKGTAKLPPGYSGAVSVDRRTDYQTRGVGNLSLAKQKLWLKQGEMAREAEKKAAVIATTVGNYASTNHGNVNLTGSGGWGNVAADIFGDIEDAKAAVMSVLGVRPNKMLISPDLRPKLRKNTGLKQFLPNNNQGASAWNLKDLANLFELDEIVESTATYTNAAGVTQYVWGTAFAALIFVEQPMGEGVFDPSDLPAAFGYKFQLDGHPYVEEFYDKESTSDKYICHDNYLHLQTSNVAGYMFESVLT